MAIINCPRCGGSGNEPASGRRCRFCKGAKKVEVDDQELERCLKGAPQLAKNVRIIGRRF